MELSYVSNWQTEFVGEEPVFHCWPASTSKETTNNSSQFFDDNFFAKNFLIEEYMKKH